MPRSRDQEKLEQSGLMDPAVGDRGFGLQEVRRPKEEVYHRYYPDPNQLMRKQRKVLASSELPALEEAIQGVLSTDFERTFGFTRQPQGNLVQPFFKLEMIPELPFEHSRILPVLSDPKETERMYAQIRAAATSTKYAAVKPEIDLALNELNRFGNDYRMILRLGLGKGPAYHYPTVEQAFRHAIMLEAVGTLPDTADMQGRMKEMGALARSTAIRRRHAHLAVLGAKGTQPGGPLLADAINVYQNYLAPSLGWRSTGLPSPLLMPTFGAPTPLTESARSKAVKNLTEMAAHEQRSAASQEYRQMSGEERVASLHKYIRQRHGEQLHHRVMRNIGGEYGGMTPERQLQSILVSLHEQTNEAGASMSRNSAVTEAVSHLGQLDKAAKEAGSPRSVHRVTKAAVNPKPEAPRVGSNLVPQKEVERIYRKTASKMKALGTPRNPLAVMALAAILSAGFMAGMESE